MQFDEIPQRLALIYKDAGDNIRFFKKQQGTVVAFSITAYAALYTLAETFEEPDRILLSVLSAVVGSACALFLWSFRRAIKRFCKRIRWIYAHHFTYSERQSLALGEDKTYLDRKGYNQTLIWLNFCVMAVTIVAIWYA